MNKKKVLTLVISYAVAVLVAFLVYYIALPPLNFYSVESWIYLTFVVALALAPISISRHVSSNDDNRNKKIPINFKFKIKKIMLFALLPIVFVLIGGIGSSTLFNARGYAGIIKVDENCEFKDDILETGNVTNAALMDSESAAVIGRRALGSLSDVVSQYELSGKYNQINYCIGGEQRPEKISNLEYADFFKWIGNRKNGIPGFVMVDPVSTNKAEYKPFKQAMKYAESGFFSDDLGRKLRFTYPSKIMGTPRFEVDDEDNPYYIVPCMKPHIFMFGAMDVDEVILFNPCNGNSDIMPVEDTPEWVDIVYSGDLASEKYNWKGMLSGGWLNSKIGNKGCKRTTDDFGYVVIGNDVWYYTGVTSVTADQSNIGFILSNARTGEYKFYSIIGADEHSAMGAAQGEVQEKGYVASFPVLINVANQPTYIMVLKDANDIVKMCALVNVEHYSLVATGDNQEEAMKNYKDLLIREGVIDGKQPESDKKDVVVTVKNIRETVQNGNTILYFECLDGENNSIVLKISVVEDERSIFIKKEDKLTVTISTKVPENNIHHILEIKNIG